MAPFRVVDFDNPDQFAGADVPDSAIGGRLRLPWMPDKLPSKVKFRLFGLDFINRNKLYTLYTKCKNLQIIANFVIIEYIPIKSLHNLGFNPG
jgi:hypothetical protein